MTSLVFNWGTIWSPSSVRSSHTWTHQSVGTCLEEY